MIVYLNSFYKKIMICKKNSAKKCGVFFRCCKKKYFFATNRLKNTETSDADRKMNLVMNKTIEQNC